MILAIENSSGRGSVALWAEGDPASREVIFESPRGRGGELYKALEIVLVSEPVLTRVVVGIGPGSYNGIRAAIAAGWGIAAARGIPLCGICSLLGLDEGAYCAVGDARAGQFYFARIADNRLEDGPRLLTADELSEALSSVAGHPVYAPAAISGRPIEIRHASALRLAQRGAHENSTSLPEPLYLKPAHITSPNRRPAFPEKTSLSVQADQGPGRRE